MSNLTLDEIPTAGNTNVTWGKVYLLTAPKVAGRSVALIKTSINLGEEGAVLLFTNGSFSSYYCCQLKIPVLCVGLIHLFLAPLSPPVIKWGYRAGLAFPGMGTVPPPSLTREQFPWLLPLWRGAHQLHCTNSSILEGQCEQKFHPLTLRMHKSANN